MRISSPFTTSEGSFSTYSPVIRFGSTTLLQYSLEEQFTRETATYDDSTYSYDSYTDSEGDSYEFYDETQSELFDYDESILTDDVDLTRASKQKYSSGINVATSFIVDYLLTNRIVNNTEIDIVACMIVLGKEIDITSTKGKKLLKEIKKQDRDFANIAFLSAMKVKKLGGDEMQMRTAIVSTLACRRFRYLKNIVFSRNQIEALSEWTADCVINRDKVEGKKSKEETDERSSRSSRYDRVPLKMCSSSSSYNDDVISYCQCNYMDVLSSFNSGLDESKAESHQTISEKENKKLRNKYRYAQGIECASEIIVNSVKSEKKLTNDLLNRIVSALVSGEDYEKENPIVIKILKSTKPQDYDIAETAYLAAYKVKNQGGKTMSMYGAVVPVLVTRNLKKWKHVAFTTSQINRIAEESANQVLNVKTPPSNFSKDENDPECFEYFTPIYREGDSFSNNSIVSSSANNDNLERELCMKKFDQVQRFIEATISEFSVEIQVVTNAEMCSI